ncbi:copper chaperone PCu(A)C [Rhodocyclaceae bacterium SMB388]
MKKALLASALTLALVMPAFAQVTVSDPWVRGTVAPQRATGAFMQLTAEKDARLVGAGSPAAGVVEIHEMAMENDVMRMRRIDRLDLPAGQTVELKPGGHHVMLMDLKQDMSADMTVPLTLIFEDAAGARFEQTIEAPVVPLGTAQQGMGAGQPMHQMHEMHRGHGQ